MVVIRTFEPADAKAVSELIRRTMCESNRRDYPLDRLQPLIDYFSPEKVLRLSQERVCLVAESEQLLVGTAALDGSQLATFFVLPDHQGRGIGKLLLDAIEQRARTLGIDRLVVDASITGAAFYARMGYVRTGVDREGTAGMQIGMEKRLPANRA